MAGSKTAQERYRAKPETKRRMQAYYAANKDRALTVARAYRSTTEGRSLRMVNSALLRDPASKPHKAELIAIVAAAIEAGYCPRTGWTFDLSPAVGRHKNPRAPSLDRLDNARGYEPGNVQVVCWSYNMAKNVGTDAELLALCRAVVNWS